MSKLLKPEYKQMKRIAFMNMIKQWILEQRITEAQGLKAMSWFDEGRTTQQTLKEKYNKEYQEFKDTYIENYKWEQK